MSRERLDKALYRIARNARVEEQRLRRWVSFLALCGALQRAIDEGVIVDYHLKGGAALELRFAERARTSKDLDIGLLGSRRERFSDLERALALGFDEFTFRVKVPYDLERADTVRVDVVIAYQTRGWQTIQIDLGPTDHYSVDLVAPAIRGVAELGILVPNPVRCLTLDVQIAQKIHASTNPRVIRSENRARDIFDVVLLDALHQLKIDAVRELCVRIFEQRGEHSWPPSIDVPATWTAELDALSQEHGSPRPTGNDIVAAFITILHRLTAGA